MQDSRHEELKKKIKSNPDLIGLDDVVIATEEFAFIKDNRDIAVCPDLAFYLRNGQWVLVEVKSSNHRRLRRRMRDQIAKAKAKDSLRVMAAGVGGNIVVAVVCILGVLLIVNGLAPAVDGVYINSVTEGMPAEAAGLLPEDVFVLLDDVTIDTYDDLNETLWNKNPGNTVQVTVARGEKWENQFSTSVNLTESDDGRAVMGVNIGELMTEERKQFYQTITVEKLSLYLLPPSLPLVQGVVPFFVQQVLVGGNVQQGEQGIVSANNSQLFDGFGPDVSRQFHIGSNLGQFLQFIRLL